MRRLLRKNVVVSSMLAGALVLAACGDDGETADDGGEAAADDGGEEAADGGGEEAADGEAADGGEASGEDWPTEPIRLIASTSVGGGTDQLARALQQPLEEELGTEVIVDNRPGGNFSVTPTIVMNEGDDCDPIMIHMSPFLEISYLTQEVDYEGYEDFATIAGLTQEPAVLYALKDSPWETIDDLIEDAKSRPGEITVGVTAASDPLFFVLQEMQDQLDVEFTVVPYEGGGPTRTALLAGEIDFMFNYLMTSAGIFDEIRILAIGSDEFERYEDLEVLQGVPVLDEELGIETTDSQLTFNAGAAAECKANHPERYQTLQDAFMAALESEAFTGLMEETGQTPWPRPMEGGEYDETVYGPSDELLTEQFGEAGLLVE